MKKVKKLSERLAEDYKVNLLDGVPYGSTARSDGYECHHLISSHFCKQHKYCISRYRAPAKESIIQLQRVPQCKVSFKAEYFESLIKEKIYPAPIRNAWRLLFDNFDN